MTAMRKLALIATLVNRQLSTANAVRSNAIVVDTFGEIVDSYRRFVNLFINP